MQCSYHLRSTILATISKFKMAVEVGVFRLIREALYFFLSFLAPTAPESSMNFCGSFKLTCQLFIGLNKYTKIVFFGHQDIVWISLFMSYRGDHKTHARIHESCLKIIELAQNVIIYSLYYFKAVLITI